MWEKEQCAWYWTGGRREGGGLAKSEAWGQVGEFGGRFGHKAEPSKPNESSPGGPVQKPRSSYYRTPVMAQTDR